MASNVTIKISTAAAAYVRKDTPRDDKLKAARGEVPFPAHDMGTLLFFLAHDPDTEIRTAAMRTVRDLPEALLLTMVRSPDLHPRILDLLARFHAGKPAVIAAIASLPGIDPETRTFLAEKGLLASTLPPEPGHCEDAEEEPAAAAEEMPEEEEAEPEKEEEKEEEEEEEEEEINEESEEFLSKYQIAQQMPIGEKIKMALTGDKEWRSILLKDSNKLVSGGVVKNPRLTEPEVLAIAKSAVQNDELLRVICANKEWLKNYQIRKALVVNNKTPLPFALRQMATLSEKDIAALAKSKNVSSVISTQARRLLLAKQEKGR